MCEVARWRWNWLEERRLILAVGRFYGEICELLDCTDRYISLWKERFKQERLSGLNSRYRGAEHRRRALFCPGGIAPTFKVLETSVLSVELRGRPINNDL